MISNPNYRPLDLNIVSLCCGSSIEQGIEVDYPLGGRTWGISYKVDVCGNCGKEAETVEECGICGEIGCLNECE
ncbi:hypothetical protein SAMN05421868_13463 [Paenibacillus naphthalenovorans]|nr:hypothetical protein SAMN05421868_13463 [Paenibacillus naphthalenovorans]